jgi:hypothetical protein
VIILETGKTDKITVSYNDQVDEFERIFLSGISIENNQKSSAIIYGYDNFDDLLTDYVNIIVTTYQFISMESTNSKEEILGAIHETTLNTLDAIKNGDLGETDTKELH